MIETKLQITHHFDVPAKLVYSAWTDPELMRQWLFKSGSNSILPIERDLIPGGKFSIIEHTEDGKAIDHFGRYHSIYRPTLLSFSLEVPEHFKGVTEVVIDLAEKPTGCEMSFTQKGVDPAIVEDAWHQMFERLGTLLQAQIE